MYTSLLRRYVREILTETYSVGLVNAMKKKFKSQNPALTDAQIEFYIDAFDKNKSTPAIQKAKGPDITKYTWTELESLIDANFSTRSLHEPVIETDMKPVYQSPDGTLQIFLGDRKEKCVRFRQEFEKRSGQQYSWCISRSDASNMFASYRFRRDEPVFYYIFDADRDLADPLHACVVYVEASDTYFLATSLNDGDKRKSWDELVTMMPKLKNIKSVFKHVPLSEREREIYELVKKPVDDETFRNFSRDVKEEYISFGHKLADDQLRDVLSLPDGKELVNKYVNMHDRTVIPFDVYKNLPSATKKVIRSKFENAQMSDVFQFFYENKTEFEGDLDLGGVELTHLPAGLKVGGNLYLSFSKITQLPTGLEVGGNLKLHNTPITQLPEGLKVGGNLDLHFTKITHLPKDLYVGGQVKPYYLDEEYQKIVAARSKMTQSENRTLSTETLLRHFVRSSLS